jgi:predicted 3-demethylubiquinone-9 3-methyltransferase (glyoxalase superfamily)
MTHTIATHLWFDKEAREAAEFYASLLPNSRIKNLTTLHNTPSGDCDIVSFELAGRPFMAISAGPLFKFNPSVSFRINCETKDEVDTLWARFSEHGQALMPLGAYPFSKWYGWVADKYGLSWQVILVGDTEPRQKIAPVLMFTGAVCGKTEEALNFYTSVFKNSPSVAEGARDTNASILARYGGGEEPDRQGTVKYAAFALQGQEFGAMDSAYAHNFSFNEAISFMVPCNRQEEIDYYWEKLSADPKAEQCGWLKDRYGLSWQIVPTLMNEMMGSKNPEKIARVTRAFLKMKKFDIAALERAYDGV